MLLKPSDAMDNNLDMTFDCTNPDYVKYYQYDALYDAQENLAQTYLLKLEKKVLGYFSIAMAHIRKENKDAMMEKGTDGNIPALLISHLATDRKFLRHGVGTALIDIALDMAKSMSRYTGCRYLILHPEDDDGVKQFYAKYGFEYIGKIVEDPKKDLFILDITTRKKS